jgi:hypothetical protein
MADRGVLCALAPRNIKTRREKAAAAEPKAFKFMAWLARSLYGECMQLAEAPSDNSLAAS